MRAFFTASLALAASLALLIPSIALAEPTEITLRVLSKDGKFVGTSMGCLLYTSDACLLYTSPSPRDRS